MPSTSWIAAVLAVPLLAGCSGGSSAPAAPPASSSTPATAATSDRPETAREIIHAIKAGEPAVSGVVIYTAATDSNHLLGRPNGYESKGAWRDTRIPASETVGFTLGDIDVGGGVEVFPSEEGAITRGGYIESLSTINHEYDFACGGVLLRISNYLTPRQAAGYQRLVAGIVGSACTPVT